MWLSIIPGVLGIGIGANVLYQDVIYHTDLQTLRANDLAVKLATEMSRLRDEQRDTLGPIISHLSQIEQHISSLSSIPKEDALNIQLQKLHDSFDDLASREAKIEAIILDNPSKALEVLLLRRDLDNVKESQQAALGSLKDNIDRIYDLNKWLLGAMAVSIVTLAAGNLLRQKETKPSMEEE